jgi:hypothetical protein
VADVPHQTADLDKAWEFEATFIGKFLSRENSYLDRCAKDIFGVFFRRILGKYQMETP